MFHVLVPLAVVGPHVEMTCSFFGIAMPAVAAPPSCFLSGLLYPDQGNIPTWSKYLLSVRCLS